MNKTDNYKDYVNALGKKGEVSMMSFSFMIYVTMTVIIMGLLCAIVLREYVTQTPLVVVPAFFTILIPVFAVWFFKAEKKAKTVAETALLYNGAVSAASAAMFLCASWIFCQFTRFFTLHLLFSAVFTVLIVLLSVYLYHTCRNGKKKKHSRKATVAGITSAVVLAGLGRHLSSGVALDNDAKVFTTLSICTLVLGFVELVCAIIELSRYYVAVKHNVKLDKK